MKGEQIEFNLQDRSNFKEKYYYKIQGVDDKNLQLLLIKKEDIQ